MKRHKYFKVTYGITDATAIIPNPPCFARSHLKLGDLRNDDSTLAKGEFRTLQN